MKCIICHSEDIELLDVKEEIHLENDIIYVPIKVATCKNCSERYYDRKTMQYLEKIGQKLKKENSGLKEVGRILEYTV